MNLLYRSPASVGGSNARCLRQIDDALHFDRCVVIEQSIDGMDVYRGKKYVKIDAQAGYKNLYRSLVDMDSLPPLDRTVLEKMEPYKSACLNMAVRNYSLYVGNYYEIEREYFDHVRYWNYILDCYAVDLVFMSVIPHCMWEYVIYALAKCRGIRTLLVSATAIPGLNIVGTSIETMGSNTIRIFQRDGELKETDLHDIVTGYYHKANQKDINLLFQGRKENPLNDKYLYRTYYRPLILKTLGDIRSPSKLATDLEILGSVIKQKCTAKSIGYYNKRAVKRPGQEAFVYFALQVTPEMSTLPWAGAFQNQLLSIRLLAGGLEKKGIRLYVKEHYYQPAVRPKSYYDELFSIPNVVCIKTDVEAYELINDCVAVASQTGSCILEAIVKKKPALTFVKSFWNCLQNVYLIDREEDVENAIDKISRGQASVSDDERKRFMLAIEHSMVRQNLDLFENPQIGTEMAGDDICDLLKQYTAADCDNDFCYERG